MTVLPDDGLSLAAEFPETTRAEWQRLVAGVLRKSGKDVGDGDDAERALATSLEDGLEISPLYTAEDTTADTAGEAAGYPGLPPYIRGSRPVAGWDVRQRHERPDPEQANEAILADLDNGATSLWLVLGAAGLPVSGLARALDGVLLDLAPIVLDAGAETDAAAGELLRLCRERGVAADAVRGNLGADPLGHAARTGAYDEQAAEQAAGWARRCREEHPGLRALTVDALPYHEAGATPAQELGCSLATGVAYLRLLTEAGLPVEAACRQLEFRYAATADQFLSTAKLRAARRLWYRVAEACGAEGDAGAQRQHAVTSPVMMARRDPYVNMLRTTVACLGAGVGGAEAVTVLPFDAAIGLPDAFARRIARNTSSILLEESNLGMVADPAGGSWYVESLTDRLARAGWAFFQELERSGGQREALRSGLVGERISAAWTARGTALATRREPVTGVSEFPHLAERPVQREAFPAAAGGGLPRVRRDDAFEALRARSDQHLAATGGRPRVFLAALGTPAAHTTRATFAANFFQAGGVEPVHDPQSVDAGGVAEAFARSGAAIACLCSSDALYEEQAEAVAAALKDAGASRVFLAGAAGAYPSVDARVHARCDAVAVLSSVLDLIGVVA